MARSARLCWRAVSSTPPHIPVLWRALGLVFLVAGLTVSPAMAVRTANVDVPPPVAANLADRARPASAVTLDVDGSPFDPDGDGQREVVRLTLVLDEPMSIDLVIRDFDGRRVRTLAAAESVPAGGTTWTWNGRDERGRRAPEGPYLARATVRTEGGAVIHRAAWLTLAERVPYPPRPGAIVVALDPGHGGIADGAVWRGLTEDDVDLDIGLRLEAMLVGAGVTVVMTRRSDRYVSPRGRDVNGDGHYDRTDELIARNDIANNARADVHIAIHNNALGCHCQRGTEMYSHRRRSWSVEGMRLARFVQAAHLRQLREVAGYRPRDRGVKSHDFKALMPYRRGLLPRPSLQASMLGESLFIDAPGEHRILASRSGRQRLAAAYFDGIARYLAWRRLGLHYEVLAAPHRVQPGGRVSTTLRLTNTGHVASYGWRLVARVVRAVPRYDGRPRRGSVTTSVRVPDGLLPGAAVEVTLPGIRLPRTVGAWLVKLDVALPSGGSMAAHGVVGPQLRVRTEQAR